VVCVQKCTFLGPNQAYSGGRTQQPVLSPPGDADQRMLKFEDHRARMSGCTQEATGEGGSGVKPNAPGMRGKEVIFHWGGWAGGGVRGSSFREEVVFK